MVDVNTKKVIFIHSMFRAGSTYLFSQFRNNNDYWSYYEPLHHDLAKLRSNNIEIWRYDKEATNAMRHPEMEKSHFYEYKNAFLANSKGLPYFKEDFSYKEFFHVFSDDSMKNYINNLIVSAPNKRIPVFQFNRTSCRANWFKKHYPESLNIALIRNPREQFESYLNRGALDCNIFLAINIYIILQSKYATQKLLRNKLFITGRVAKDLSVCMKASSVMSVYDHYLIFYYIWKLSAIHSKEYADLEMDMDELQINPMRKKDAESAIFYYSDRNFCLSNYDLPLTNKYTLSSDEQVKAQGYIESLIESDYDDILQSNVYSGVNMKSAGIFSKIFDKYFS